MRLRYQKRALEQIDKALGDVAARSPQGAARIEARLEAIATLVQLHSFVGGKTSAPRVRRVLHLIDYYVGNDEIVIQRFPHAARAPVSYPLDLTTEGKRGE